MEKYKKLITFAIPIIILVCLFIYRTIENKKIRDTEENKINISDISNTQTQLGNITSSENIEQETNMIFEKVSNRDEYFAIKDRLTMFYMYISFINKDTYIKSGFVENVDEKSKELQTLGLTSIKNMLDASYIKEMNPTSQSIIQEAIRYKMYGNNSADADYSMQIKNIYKYQLSDNQYMYLVDISTSKTESQMILKLDFKTKRFSIFLQDYIEKYNYSNDMKKEDITITSKEIEENDGNSFTYNSTKEVNMAKEYFSLLKNNLLNNSKGIYSLLNEEYKTKRFSNYEEFQKYIKLMNDRINNITLSEYLVENQKDGTIRYNLLDNYENCYIITVNKDDLLDYDIQLDDYTIETEDFKNLYENAKDTEKVYTNIAKFFKMINNKDYESAYNVLAGSYKKNYFQTFEKFERYAKEKFFDYTIIEKSEDVTKSGSYYVCTVMTSSKNGQERSETFVVSLEEGTEFELSFTIK